MIPESPPAGMVNVGASTIARPMKKHPGKVMRRILELIGAVSFGIFAVSARAELSQPNTV